MGADEDTEEDGHDDKELLESLAASTSIDSLCFRFFRAMSDNSVVAWPSPSCSDSSKLRFGDRPSRLGGLSRRWTRRGVAAGAIDDGAVETDAFVVVDRLVVVGEDARDRDGSGDGGSGI